MLLNCCLTRSELETTSGSPAFGALSLDSPVSGMMKNEPKLWHAQSLLLLSSLPSSRRKPFSWPVSCLFRVNEMKCFDSQPTSFVLRNQYNCSNLNLLPNSLRVPFVVLCRARIRFVLYTNSFFCAELPAAPALSRQDQARIGGVLYTNSHMRAKSASPPSIILQS